MKTVMHMKSSDKQPQLSKSLENLLYHITLDAICVTPFRNLEPDVKASFHVLLAIS